MKKKDRKPEASEEGSLVFLVRFGCYTYKAGEKLVEATPYRPNPSRECIISLVRKGQSLRRVKVFLLTKKAPNPHLSFHSSFSFPSQTSETCNEKKL